MKLNEAVKLCHEIAKEKGWHDNDRRPLEIHALITSEIAEATEEIRKPKGPAHEWFWIDESGKPEGEAVELVDAVIRIFDYFGAQNWDFEQVFNLKTEYNKTRSHRHGGKTV